MGRRVDDTSSWGGITFWILAFWLVVPAIVITGFVTLFRARSAGKHSPPALTTTDTTNDADVTRGGPDPWRSPAGRVDADPTGWDG